MSLSLSDVPRKSLFCKNYNLRVCSFHETADHFTDWLVHSYVVLFGASYPLANQRTFATSCFLVLFNDFISQSRPGLEECTECTECTNARAPKGWRGKPLITMGLLILYSSTHLVVTGEKTHTVVPDAHTGVVCVVKGRGDPW